MIRPNRAIDPGLASPPARSAGPWARPCSNISLAPPRPLVVLAVVALAIAPANGEPKRWMTVPGKTRVSFDASFPLGNFTGRAKDVGGTFHADPADLRQGVSGALRVNAATLRTGVESRDRDMWNALAVERYPDIRFTVERVEASFPSVTDRSDVLLTIGGRMLIRGVERPMAFPARVRRRDDGLWVRGEGDLKMSDFGITPPRKFFLQVADAVLLSFDVQLVEEN